MIEQHHLDMLAGSGITPEHAALRGYETITSENKSRLAEVNIVTTGRKTPDYSSRNCVSTGRPGGTSTGLMSRGCATASRSGTRAPGSSETD